MEKDFASWGTSLCNFSEKVFDADRSPYNIPAFLRNLGPKLLQEGSVFTIYLEFSSSRLLHK